MKVYLVECHSDYGYSYCDRIFVSLTKAKLYVSSIKYFNGWEEYDEKTKSICSKKGLNGFSYEISEFEVEGEQE